MGMHSALKEDLEDYIEADVNEDDVDEEQVCIIGCHLLKKEFVSLIF